MGKTFEKIGDERKAIITYNKLNSLYPAETIGFYQIGKLFYKKGDFDIACDNFSRIITIDPLHYKSHVYLAIIRRLDRHDHKKVELVLSHLHQAKEEALDNNKFRIMINLNFAEIYEEQMNYDLSIKYYYVVNGLQSNNIDILVHLADLHLKKQKYVTALNLYLTVHQTSPHMSFAMNQIANLYAYLSKYEEAIRYFELILNHEPQNMHIILTLGRLLRDKVGKLEEAKKTFERGINLENSHLIFYEVG